eukprot:gene14573-biopygen12928
MTNTTHFGYKTVSEDDKVKEVAKVFHSVAAKYDVMNDLMSAGLHRLWKTFTIANAAVRPGFKCLDIAGGSRLDDRPHRLARDERSPPKAPASERPGDC